VDNTNKSAIIKQEIIALIQTRLKHLFIYLGIRTQ